MKRIALTSAALLALAGIAQADALGNLVQSVTVNRGETCTRHEETFADYREEGWKLMTLQLGTVAL
jgi:hypothetical protein